MDINLGFFFFQISTCFHRLGPTVAINIAGCRTKFIGMLFIPPSVQTEGVILSLNQLDPELTLNGNFYQKDQMHPMSNHTA